MPQLDKIFSPKFLERLLPEYNEDIKDFYLPISVIDGMYISISPEEGWPTLPDETNQYFVNHVYIEYEDTSVEFNNSGDIYINEKRTDIGDNYIDEYLIR